MYRVGSYLIDFCLKKREKMERKEAQPIYAFVISHNKIKANQSGTLLLRLVAVMNKEK
jgi:hypothetical protein